MFQKAQEWLKDFSSALEQGNALDLTELFFEESFWRDLVAFTWDVKQVHGLSAISEELSRAAVAVRPRDFAVHPDRTPPRVVPETDSRQAEFFFRFATDAGHGEGYVILRMDQQARHGMRAYMLGTNLTDLVGRPEKVPGSREQLFGFEPTEPGQNWAEYVEKRSSFDDRDPEVLIVGGGQAGLSVGAELERLGVDYLIIDKGERPGDSWRERYHSLSLHTALSRNKLPYMDLSANFPPYISKDKWANWVESYARTMDLNYWSSTEFLEGSFDDETASWVAQVRLADGVIRTMRPKHLVMAKGIVGRPRIPDLPGLNDFAGEIVHSSQFKHGEDYRGKNVMVVGVGTSAHDIALDLYNHGATTKMLQRGPVTVVDIAVANRAYDFHVPRMTVPEADQRTDAMLVLPVFTENMKAYTQKANEWSAELHAGLRKAGMKISGAENETGWLYMVYSSRSGYYLDQGCSPVIIDGGIKVLHMEHVDRFVPEGLRFIDGTVLPLDALVMATGFQNLQVEVEAMVGSEIAERVGPVGGFGEDGEVRNFCRPTAQQQFWIVFGGVMDCRKGAKQMAFQIKAQLGGLVPALSRSSDGRLDPCPYDAIVQARDVSLLV
ncbi:NAD(P)/FAD-dependent oxidoreductase [Pseudarthrobacter sulfonivorans]